MRAVRPSLDSQSTLVLDPLCIGEGEHALEARARLCHIINNKLAPILTYAELGERVSQDEKVQAYCARIYQSACELRALVHAAVEDDTPEPAKAGTLS